MKNKKAIVTIAIGEKYYASWKKFCEPNWKQYADRYGFDLVCLERPLDTSKRAGTRSVAWQKCLILGQDFAESYDQIVWIDSDIMINALAPDITAGVPLDKVGATELRGFDMAFLERAFKLWPTSIINYTPQEYYSTWGLPADCDKVINTGVMILSPRFHRTNLEHVYYAYEEKGGREWHMEMRPLSYELVKAGAVHWIDPRFNVMWPFEEIVHYPFLLPSPAPKGLRARIERKIQTVVNSSSLRTLRAAAVNTVYQSNFFLHFGGINTEEMQMVKQRATSWWDILA
jgi:hypothetical protein